MTPPAIERPASGGRLHDALRWAPVRTRAKAGTLTILCALAFVTVIAVFQVPYRHTIRVGAPTDVRTLSGFFAPEGSGSFTYRWTTDRASVRLPQGIFPGEADVILAGDRPGSAPPRVTMLLEDTPDAPLAQVQSAANFASYPIRLPIAGGSANPAEVPGLVLLPADTVTPPKDDRALGVAVERVIVYTNPLRFGPVAPTPLALLLTLGIVAALALVALSLALPMGQLLAVAYGPALLIAAYLALRRSDDPGQQAHAVVGFTVAALVAVAVIWRQSLAARPWVRTLARLDGRWPLGAATFGTLAYALYASHRLFGQLYDDTHITLRYARNLADGYGLRFNPGERPVEGYTNFLLTVTLGGCAKLGLPLETMAKVLSIGAALGGVVATYWLASLLLPGASGLLRATPSLMMAICGWFAYYAAIGLETHLFALLVTVAACLVLIRRWPWAGVMFAAAYLTRPEGAGLWAVTLGWLGWQAWIAPKWPFRPAWHAHGDHRIATDDTQPRPTSRDIAWFVVLFLAIAGAHEVWRLWYYREPVPNTFYDKVGSTLQQVQRGWDYVAYILPELHPLTLALVIAALVLLPSAAVAGRATRYVALLASAFVAYIILVGGDFIGPRFLFHVFPFVTVLAVAGIRSLLRRPQWLTTRGAHDGGDLWPRSSPLAGFSVFLIAVWLFLPLLPPDSFATARVGETHMRIETGLTALGAYLRDTAPPGATLAIDAAGVTPYISGLATLDMLGLSDYHIAHTAVASGEGVAGHEKTDPQYVLAQRPTYIAVGMSKLSSGGRPGRGLDLPGFDAQYTRVALVRMTASRVSPDLVLVLTPGTNIQAAIDAGYTYGLYMHM